MISWESIAIVVFLIVLLDGLFVGRRETEDGAPMCIPSRRSLTGTAGKNIVSVSDQIRQINEDNIKLLAARSESLKVERHVVQKQSDRILDRILEYMENER